MAPVGAVGLEKQQGPCRDRKHWHQAGDLWSVWCKLAGIGAGSSFGPGQWWPSGSPPGIRNSGVLQPRPWGGAENGTCGCSRWTLMTAKESSRAIWRPCQPKGEDQGLGFHRSPAPGLEPMSGILVTQNPSSGLSPAGRRRSGPGYSYFLAERPPWFLFWGTACEQCVGLH